MKNTRIKQIIQVVADRYSVKPSDILSCHKTRTVARARAAVMYILRQAGYSTTYIGEMLNKHHATVIMSCRRIEEDFAYQKEVEAIEIDISPEPEEVKPSEKCYAHNGKWRKLFGQFKATCQVCGFEDIVEIHHIIPLKNGGSNNGTNILILCSNHHKMLHLGMLYVDKIKPKELVTAC